MGKYLPGQSMQLRFRLLAISLVFVVVVSGLDNSCRHHERFVSPDQSPIRVGGLFSVHRQRVNAINGQTQCTVNDPSTKPAFHRYAVEQVEALVFAATKTEMGYAIWDTCGQLHTACPVEQAKSLNADNGVIATLIGPYYSVGSNRIDKFNIERLYREIADDAETTRRRGVLPFLDEPFLDDYATKLGETLVYVQQSCLLQSRAVVDFATAAGWRAVAVVTSDDNCGRESVAEFRRATRERGCEIDATFYRERETARLLGRRRRQNDEDDDVKIWPSVRQLWEYDIGLTPERPVVFLGSVSYARRFFAAYASPTTTTALRANRDAFRFLVGDFWGEPSEADDLYEIVVNASSLARSFVALRTASEGIDAFERHFNSIRANSTETMRRNPFLKAFWEDYFDCDIAAGTCDNSSALSLVERPILRNYQAASIIDAVFLLSSYAKEFRRANPPTSHIYFSTREKFFLDTKTNLQTTTTNVTSWTGERVRVGVVRAPAVTSAAAAAWTQRVDWTYDVLLLNGTSSALVGRWDFNAGNGSLSRLGNNYTWSKVCSTAATPTVAGTSSWIPDGDDDDDHHQTESPPTSASRRSEERLVFLTLPGLVALLHIFVALLHIFVALYSVHKLSWSSFVHKVVFSVGGLLLLLVTVVSFSVSVLLCTSVFTCRSGDESWFHFAINLASIGVFAAIFVQLLLHQIGGCFDRFSYKVATYFAIVLAGTILLVFVCFYRDEALIVASYFINVILTTGSAILLWMPKKINAFRYPKAIATLAGLLAVSHASCVGLALWSSSNRRVFLIALSTFPSIVTLFLLIAVVEYQSRRPASSSNPAGQTELYRGPSHRYVEQMQQPIESDARGTVFTYWDRDIVKEINSVLIEPERIKIEERIGQGNFGEVFKGIMDAVKNVAMKSVHDTMDQKEVNDLVREGLQMRAFRHPNVMELYGLCWSDDPANVRHTSPLIILPYMELGDLKNYLRQCRLGRRASVHFHLPDQQRKIDLSQAEVSVVDRVKFCHQIAKGMEYIAANGIVHRDLAARNCMINWDLEVKVADFGLARAMKEGKDYYRMNQVLSLPIRWMALESLVDFVFTFKSDVWSYGITMWEVMTLAMVPYPGQCNQDIIFTVGLSTAEAGYMPYRNI